WCRRNRLVAGLTAAVAVVLLAGTLVSSFFAIKAEAEADAAREEKERADGEAKVARDEKERVDEAARTARRHLYLAHMNLVERHWEAGRLDLVDQFLEEEIPKNSDDEDRRGFEWFHQKYV